MSSASHRLPTTFAPNRWAQRIDERRTAGHALLDLTVSNPTRVGLAGATVECLRALSDPRGAQDDPDPRGLASARAAVADHYAARGTPLDPEALVLTSGTSESYAHLFRLLGDPGDAVLAPTPSYPLIEPIARLEGLEVVPYRLAWDGAWHLDLGSLDQALDRAGERARAAIVVEPNHPTSSCLAAVEREALEARLERRGLALISDEVFADFPWAPGASPFPGWLGERRVPTFVLGGLSKCCGLPQLKLGWIAVAGPERSAWLDRLEWIADLFLTVNRPTQLALPELLAARGSYQTRVRERLAANVGALERFVRREPRASVLGGGGGWGVVLRLPAAAVEDWALALIEQDVIVHPGHFYELEESGCVVASLITPTDGFEAGLARIAEIVAAS